MTFTQIKKIAETVLDTANLGNRKIYYFGGQTIITVFEPGCTATLQIAEDLSTRVTVQALGEGFHVGEVYADLDYVIDRVTSALNKICLNLQ